ncbi:MAG: DsrE family protein, partial [Acidobacteriota bacterium]
EGSPVLPGLRLIQGMGVRLLVCGSCVEHYRLQGQIAVGEVTTMSEIVKALLAADKVITA